MADETVASLGFSGQFGPLLIDALALLVGTYGGKVAMLATGIGGEELDEINRQLKKYLVNARLTDNPAAPPGIQTLVFEDAQQGMPWAPGSTKGVRL